MISAQSLACPAHGLYCPCTRDSLPWCPCRRRRMFFPICPGSRISRFGTGIVALPVLDKRAFFFFLPLHLFHRNRVAGRCCDSHLENRQFPQESGLICSTCRPMERITVSSPILSAIGCDSVARRQTCPAQSPITLKSSLSILPEIGYATWRGHQHDPVAFRRPSDPSGLGFPPVFCTDTNVQLTSTVHPIASLVELRSAPTRRLALLP